MGRVSMPQGKGSQLHNRRDYNKIGKPLPSNINPALTAENIVLVDKDIKEAYHEIFDDALAAYNARQTRADRKIDDYYTHIQKSKNGEKIFYEDVLQWGAKSDFERPETRQKAAEALKAYVSTFERRNPNLRLVGAYIHMDEASPHLHLDYIPVASGYKRGLALRNSLDRAMKQMGYQPENESRKDNATKLWKEHERTVFRDICLDMGLEVDAERLSDRKNLSVAEYKTAKDAMIAQVRQEIAPDLIAVSTEYEAKKAYVQECEKKSANMYPDGVKLKRSFFSGETVIVPKKMWEQKYLSASERIMLQREREALESGIKRFQRSASGQTLAEQSRKIKDLERTVSDLEFENEKLKSKLSQEEGKAERVIEKINEVLAVLPENMADAFSRAWKSLDRHRQRDR